MTQYIRGHLFVFLDQLMGKTYKSADIDEEDWKGGHAFEHCSIQLLFRTFLKFAACYFKKVATLGHSVSVNDALIN